MDRFLIDKYIHELIWTHCKKLNLIPDFTHISDGTIGGVAIFQKEDMELYQYNMILPESLRRGHIVALSDEEYSIYHDGHKMFKVHINDPKFSDKIVKFLESVRDMNKGWRDG